MQLGFIIFKRRMYIWHQRNKNRLRRWYRDNKYKYKIWCQNMKDKCICGSHNIKLD